MENKAKEILSDTGILMTAIFLAKSVGFARDIIISSMFGTTNISDAYLLSFSMPDMFINVISSAVLTSFLPFYNKLEKNKGEQQTFVNQVVSILLLLSTIIYAGFYIFSNNIFNVIAKGFDDETLRLTVSLSRIMMIVVLFVMISNLNKSFLEYKGYYFSANISGIIFNACAIGGVLLSSKFGLKFAAYGYVLGYFLMSMFLIALGRKSGLNFKLVNPFQTNENVRSFIKLILPIIFSQAMLYVSQIVDKSISTRLSQGSLSAISYSTNIINLIKSLTMIPLMTVIFPRFIKTKDEDLLRDSFELMSTLMIPIALFTYTFSTPMVDFLYGRGSFDTESIKLTAESLKGFSILLVTNGLTMILHKWYHAHNNTKSPLIQSISVVVFNIVFTLVLYAKYEHIGIALGSSMASLVSLIIYFIHYYRTSNVNSLKSVLHLVKCLFIAFISIFLVTKLEVFVYTQGSKMNILKYLIINGLSFVIIYIILIFLTSGKLFQRRD